MVRWLALAFLLWPVFSGCAPSPEKSARAGTAGAAAAKVEVLTPLRTTIRRLTEQPGQIEAYEVTSIHAKVSGYVRDWSVDIGERIKKGQVIARLAVPEIEAELEQKKAAIDEAQAERAQTDAAVKVAEAGVATARAQLVTVRAGIPRTEADRTRWQAEYRRIEQLFREKAMTGTLVDETRNKLESAEAAHVETDAKVRSAEAALLESHAHLEKARADVLAADAHLKVARFDAARTQALVDYAAIVAPYDGTVIRRNVDTGNLTQPGASSSPLFVVSRSDVVRIAVDVPEMDATDVVPGKRAEVRIQALKDRVFEGKVARTSFDLDPKTRTLAVEIDLPNPDGLLRPGQFAHASITLEEHPKVLTLPNTALIRDGARAFCVRVAKGRAERTEVKTGLNDGSKTEILAGIDPGDLIVKANAAALVNGQTVEPVEGEKMAKP